MRRFCVVAVAGAVAAFVLLSPAGSTRGAATPVRVTLIGDSVADSLEYAPAAERSLGRGYDMHFDLRVCRRLATPGCPYAGGTPPSALDAVHESGARLGQVLVVDVGYNDDPAQYRRGMDDVVETARALGVRRIVWVTLRETRPVYRETNGVIRAEAKRFPQVDVADWNAWSTGRALFRGDGLHLSASGASALAVWLRPYLLRAASAARATA
jgi:hypothetical protein